MRYEPLGNYVSLTQGLAVNKGNVHLFSDAKSDDFPHPLLRIVDMDSGTYSKYVSKNVSPSVIANEQTIVYTRTGQIGYCFRGYSGVIHNNSFIVKLISDKISDDYLFVVLQSEFVRNQALKLAKSSVIPDLTHDMFKSIKIPVCDRKTQNKIVNIYNCLNDKIALNDSICSDLESMAKLLYDYWFVQFDFPDENGRPYKSSGGKMVWNDELKREIPEGWEVKNLQGLFNEKRGISYTSKNIKSNVGMPMINLACINTNREYRDGELKYYEGILKNKTVLHGGELLVACTDLTRNADIIGCPIFVPEDGKEYLYTMDLVQILPSQKYFDELYFGKMLQTDYYHNYIKKWASGTNVLHLNLDGMRWYKTWIPPLPLQKRFSSIIKNINKKESLIMLENQQLTSLRDFLLPMLMNGQVTFKEEA